jgi:hypothetical protein
VSAAEADDERTRAQKRLAREEAALLIGQEKVRKLIAELRRTIASLPCAEPADAGLAGERKPGRLLPEPGRMMGQSRRQRPFEEARLLEDVRERSYGVAPAGPVDQEQDTSLNSPLTPSPTSAPR